MQLQELFVLADESLSHVVSEIDDTRWETQLPADFQTTSQEPVTLRRVVNQHAYDDAWVPDMVAGRTMDEVGKDKFDGDLLGADPKNSFATVVARATEAVRVLSADDLERTAHCSFGDFSVADYLKQITAYRGLRVYDISRAMDMSTEMPEALVTGLYEMLCPIANEWRTYGVFGPAVATPPNASGKDKLLGLTGRQPEDQY